METGGRVLLVLVLISAIFSSSNAQVITTISEILKDRIIKLSVGINQVIGGHLMPLSPCMQCRPSATCLTRVQLPASRLRHRPTRHRQHRPAAARCPMPTWAASARTRTQRSCRLSESIPTLLCSSPASANSLIPPTAEWKTRSTYNTTFQTASLIITVDQRSWWIGRDGCYTVWRV